MPSVERMMIVNAANKQASSVAGAKPLTEEAAADWRSALQLLYNAAEHVYQTGLQLGVPKELARLPVPVARYSRMRASANLRNWLAFLTLRNAPDAQWEIRQYAIAVEVEIRLKFPRTWALFVAGKPE
jgi:thymidylate synthase (FAD)